MAAPVVVQFANYIVTTGDFSGTNVVLDAAPTAGNLLIAGVPIDYPASEDFVTVNPYWTLIINQGGNTTPWLPMLWYSHAVGTGESANLPPFYDGFIPGDNFTQYVGAVVYEVSGAATDLSALQNSQQSFFGGPVSDYALDPTYDTDNADTLTFAFVTGNNEVINGPYAVITLVEGASWSGVTYNESPVGSEVGNAATWLDAYQTNATLGTTIAYNVTYSDPSFGCMASSLTLRAFGSTPPPTPTPAPGPIAPVFGSAGQWRGQVGINWKGMALVGDATAGMIGLSDFGSFTEYGNTMELLVTSPPIQKDRLRLFLRLFEVDVQAGVGDTTGVAADPKLLLDFSKDGGMTWQPQLMARSMGAVGEYRRRLRWINLGSSRAWVMRLRCSDPVRRVIIGAFVDTGVGTG